MGYKQVTIKTSQSCYEFVCQSTNLYSGAANPLAQTHGQNTKAHILLAACRSKAGDTVTYILLSSNRLRKTFIPRLTEPTS